MEFRILGPLEVRDQGHVLPLTAAKPRALLAILLVHPNEAVSSDRLIDALWGETPPPTAANALQVYVTQVRRLLEPQRAKRAPSEVLPARAGGYALRAEPEALDAERFERQLEMAIAVAGRGTRRAQPRVFARRSTCGAGRRWRTSPTSRSRRRRSPASRSSA